MTILAERGRGSRIGHRTCPGSWQTPCMADLSELKLPPHLQAEALDLGAIPYIPALGRDGTAEWLKRGGGT